MIKERERKNVGEGESENVREEGLDKQTD